MINVLKLFGITILALGVLTTSGVKAETKIAATKATISKATASKIPDGNTLEFQILRNGNAFGMHYLEFNVDGDKVTTNIKIDMDVSLAFITLFEYAHTNTEVIEDEHLISIDAYTDDDGKEYTLKAKREGDSIIINSSKQGDYEANNKIAPGTYWNIEMLNRAQVLNTQKGMLEDITITDKGVEQVEVAGEYVPATHYVVSIPRRDIHVWYHTETKQWVDLQFEIRGSKIDYKRLTPISSRDNAPQKNG